MSTKPVSAEFGRLDDTHIAEELILGSLQSISMYADDDENYSLTVERRRFYGGILKVAVDYYLTRLEPTPDEG